MALPAPVGRQRDVVYLNASGHIVVLGTAGTGKTVMAIHRAMRLANPASVNHGPTLLLTYTNSLVTYLRHLIGSTSLNVTVETYGSFGRGYLNSIGRMGYNQIAKPEFRTYEIERAIKAVAATYMAGEKFFDRPLDFFSDELEWIDGNGLKTLAQYLAIKRVGRMAPLHPSAREAVWKIHEQYHAYRIADGKPYDWPSLPSAVLEALAADGRARLYKHVVVDEAQDMSPEAIRSLAAAIPPEGSLTLFADYAQQIYGQRVSWQSCGLRVARQERFLDNYRNSPEVARLAIAMSDMPHFKDSPDLVEPKLPARASGAKPTLVKCADRTEESKLVSDTAAELGRTGRVAVLGRTRAEARMATAGIPSRRMLHDKMISWDISNGVYAGTYHSAKGLEFDSVLLPFCNADTRPDAETVEAFGFDEAAGRVSRQLYVGVTRARAELILTYSGELTPLLPPPDSDLYTVVS